MPPKPKITKEMILDTVLALTREAGFGQVNARSIAARLGCSTRPIFTCYANMEELKQEFLEAAFAFYTQYTAEYGCRAGLDPCLVLPLSYVAFAREETEVFLLLFVSDMDLQMDEPRDFYREAGNEEKALMFAETLGLSPEQGKKVFLDLFLYAHGIAVLTAEGKLSLSDPSVERMTENVLEALVRQELAGVPRQDTDTESEGRT